ncbi:TIGR00366 family protein [Lentibacillus sp. N15]|uniref:YfcC family protein n=1 Tax=Lentibacillus songyuanensis TaxID=3136161 RepID=UPI0031BA1F2B
MKFRMPHIFIVLFIAIILAGIVTWIVPAGEYQRTDGVDGREVIDPDTYHHIASNPSGIMDILSAIPRGLVDAGEVVFAVLIVGGAFGVIHATKTIDLGLNRFTKAFKGKEIFMIPIIMVIFGLIASFIGTPELTLIYIPIILSLSLTNKWDSMTAVAITLIGVTAGFGTALISPFSVGLAQQLAEVKIGSGIGLRVIVFLAMLLSGALYILHYVKKITKNPDSSLTKEEDKTIEVEIEDNNTKANYRHGLTGIILLGGLVVFVYGVINHGWYLTELSAVFIFITVLVALVHRMKLDTIAHEFTNGCKSVLVGALVVGFARGIALLLEDGLIMDTIISALSSLVANLPSGITAVGMLLVQTIINFVVPSSSGQAVIAMPIMIPIADIVDVSRQTTILAFQLGDGLSNIFFPTSGYFMATLAMAKVPYQKWIKFFAPLMGIWLIIGGIALFVAQVIGWQ